MGLYVIDTEWGMGLIEARTLQAARARGRRDHGELHFRSARRATQKDIDHVRAMGGWVPEGKVSRGKN